MATYDVKGWKVPGGCVSMWRDLILAAGLFACLILAGPFARRIGRPSRSRSICRRAPGCLSRVRR